MANYLRSNSICPNPCDQLKQCVKTNDCEGIEKIIENNQELLNLEIEDGKTILHLACLDFADDVHAKTIHKLLHLGANPLYSNEQGLHRAALHFSVLGQKPEIVKAIISSLSAEDRNQTANGNTALHTLVKDIKTTNASIMECVRILSDNGVDLRRTDKKNNTALYWAAKKQLTDIIKYLLSKDARVTEKEADELRKLPRVPVFAVIGDNSTGLKTALEHLRHKDEKSFLVKIAIDPHDNDDKAEESFLQYACAHHLYQACEVLILQDPNKKGKQNDMLPLSIALSRGYYKIVELFLDNPRTHVPSNILNEALKQVDYDKYDNADFQKCCELIMQVKGLDVNTKDRVGNYPLHYAAKYGGKKLVKELLKRKASLANRDSYNYLAITDIDYETLEEHFNECIEAHPGDKIDKEGMYLTFDYTTLMPSCQPSSQPPPCNSEDSDLEKLNFNQVKECFKRECDVVLHLTKDPEQKPLLLHPLIVSFLNVKWHRVRMLFYINLMIYLIFCASLLVYILSYYDEPSSNRLGFSSVVLCLTTVVITFREGFQLVLMTRKYFKNIDNYIELALLVDVYLLLFWTSATDHQRRPLYAFAVLLAALELLFLLGSIPGLSTYIIMLRTVSYNFCKFLMFNAILILAFAFSFYTLFRKSPGDITDDAKNNNPDQEDGEQEDKFFTNIYIAFFKTLIMLTGEFEAGELDFNQFPIASHLIFIMFVVLIAIILLNLLNGLAVSDTAEIKSEAKLIALTARAQYISYVESLTFANGFLSSFGNCGCCGISQNSENTKTFSKSFLKSVGIKNAYLNDKNQLKVFANQGGRIELPDNSNICFQRWIFSLDESTIKKARVIVTERIEADEQEKSLENVISLLNTLSERMSELEKKLK